MNQKQIGIIVLIVGVLLSLFVYGSKIREDNYIDAIIDAQGGSCYLMDGTCLHEDRNYTPFILGGIMSAALMIMGVYLLLFQSTFKKIAEQQDSVAKSLEEVKKNNIESEKFNAFLTGFTEEEQSILKAIKEQDGIKQSTLRFRTGLTKSTLSVLLKSLESREHISRKPSGKTNEVYLRKKF